MRPFRQGHAKHGLEIHAQRRQVACQTQTRSTDTRPERASVQTAPRTNPLLREPQDWTSNAGQTHPDRARQSAHPRVLNRRAHTGRKRFPPNKFRHFLTLFSKFFASFPHGTCSLSVSRQYLALREIYLPFRLQSRATRLSGNDTPMSHSARTGLSPSLVSLSREFGRKTHLNRNLQTTIRDS